MLEAEKIMTELRRLEKELAMVSHRQEVPERAESDLQRSLLKRLFQGEQGLKKPSLPPWQRLRLY